MSDEIDRASDAAQFANDLAIHQHQIDNALPAQQVIDGVVECLDCGIEISNDRLEALPDCVRCIDCQIIYERKVKNGL